MIKPTFIAAFAALATAKIAPSVHRHLESNEDVDVVIEFKGGNQRALEAARRERASFKDRGSSIAHSPTPIDIDGHGTHVTGSAVGQNGIGVAPGATWIACLGCTNRICPEAAIMGCVQWMLCPTDVTGKNPKCELAPDVINNSWGFNVSTTAYQSVIDAWRAADIIPVFANGNYGPKCSTTPTDYKNIIAVGELGFDDKLAKESSRGPTADGRIKPDVSAPGTRIRSAWHTGNSAYNTISGTSMASPHVAGAIALYLSANKGAKYDQVYKAFTTTADTATLTPNNENCGGVSDSKYPNNNYGFGRINVANAIGGGVAPPSPSTPTPSPSKPSTLGPSTSGPATPFVVEAQHIKFFDPRHQYTPSVV
ncbi:hypothetical protein H257_09388 [Aphanomyces astaci]|uniref:subtilisin n=1 Tax=Aphanomyces astaci TaxID=112090 RepID=W4GBC1_APHAT|nr:hypothetical protein H257_09388 [Aphanomyces astaci]ETV76982.1 hypothetical protein H257_09388 [Aphanomyces astaci]|eukprot:XP_009833894.1 hypothetical protein H257_09388 [Aphanomyces astaci]